MGVVKVNFRKLLGQATVLSEPVSSQERDLYKRQKCQLVNSMLFYMIQIISDRMKFVIEGSKANKLCKALQKVYLLQQEILKLENFPQDFKKTCKQFNLQDFYCPNPLVFFLKMALSSGNHISGLNSIFNLFHNLGFKTIRDCQKYHSVISACIMALDKPKHSIIIPATKNSYNMPKLQRASVQLWDSQQKQLQAKCLNANFGCMLRLKELSKDFLKVVEKLNVKNIDSLVNTNNQNVKQFFQVHANDQIQKQVNLTGNDNILAT